MSKCQMGLQVMDCPLILLCFLQGVVKRRPGDAVFGASLGVSMKTWGGFGHLFCRGVPQPPLSFLGIFIHY